LLVVVVTTTISLIANHTWSSRDEKGERLYHVGTCPGEEEEEEEY